MRYVVDASVALKWVLPEPLASKALQLRDDHRNQIHKLLAPHIFLDEVASALTKAERKKILAVGQAAPLYAKVMNEAPLFLPHVHLIPRALDISSQMRIGFYDCLYVALAESENCECVTADDPLVNNLQKQFPFVRHLSTLP